MITGTPLATSPYVSYVVTATGPMTIAEAELVIGVGTRSEDDLARAGGTATEALAERKVETTRDVRVAQASVRAHEQRRLVGREDGALGFEPEDLPKKREAAVKRWRDWLAEQKK